MGRYDMMKYERGQVWMIRPKEDRSVGHEQSKDRPYLIVSVGKFNNTSGMITIVPLTSRNQTCSPSQVLIDRDDKGYKNVIMCEQIKTIDHSSGYYSMEFMGVLSDDVMRQVDKALSIHLGMQYSSLSLDVLYDSIESIVKGVLNTNTDKSKPFTDEDVLDFAIKVQELTKKNMPETSSVSDAEVTNFVSDTTVTGPTVIEDEDSSTSEPAVEDSVSNTDAPTGSEDKTTRITWTPEKCKEFISDTENLPMTKVMEKWNISKKTRYYSMRNYARYLLEKQES